MNSPLPYACNQIHLYTNLTFINDNVLDIVILLTMSDEVECTDYNDKLPSICKTSTSRIFDNSIYVVAQFYYVECMCQR